MYISFLSDRLDYPSSSYDVCFCAYPLHTKMASNSCCLETKPFSWLITDSELVTVVSTVTLHLVQLEFLSTLLSPSIGFMQVTRLLN